MTDEVVANIDSLINNIGLRNLRYEKYLQSQSLKKSLS